MNKKLFSYNVIYSDILITRINFHPCFNRDYEAQNHSATEVKAEVENHLREKEIIENIIPPNIVIGPFHINTENVRQALSKKRKALSNAVLELLARKLRTQADEASIQISRE